MSAISIETKKVTELTAFTTPTDSCLIPIHDGTGLKKITFADFKAEVIAGTESKLAPLIYNNAWAHNAIYRGKSLGSSVTTTQYAAIKAGTFADLYIGDYWTINKINYRIAAFDYYLNSGDTSCASHHVVIVPDTRLYSEAMNSTATTEGAYVGSAMYETGLDSAKTTVKFAFGSHVLKHRVFLANAMANGYASGRAWCDSEVELMSERMVYGSSICTPMSNGTSVPSNNTLDKTQLPLFQYNPSLIRTGSTWWLRDVANKTDFALVGSTSLADRGDASVSRGVRPVFCVY